MTDEKKAVSTEEARPTEIKIGDSVQWLGQEGMCEGPVLSITEPEPGIKVLHIDIGFGADFTFPIGVKSVTKKTEETR